MYWICWSDEEIRSVCRILLTVFLAVATFMDSSWRCKTGGLCEREVAYLMRRFQIWPWYIGVVSTDPVGGEGGSCHLWWKKPQMLTPKIMGAIHVTDSVSMCNISLINGHSIWSSLTLRVSISFIFRRSFSCFSRSLPKFFDWRCRAGVFRESEPTERRRQRDMRTDDRQLNCALLPSPFNNRVF
jgi:hypothetical protein